MINLTPITGERNPRAKLTTKQVYDILAGLDAGQSVTTLASMYGVHKSTISKIKNKKRWAHILKGVEV